jgi:hypothetical protein
MKDSQTKTLEKIYTSYFKGGLPISPYVTLNLIDIDFNKTSDPTFKTQFILTGTFDVNIDKDIIATDYYSIDDATNFHIKDIWNDIGYSDEYGELFISKINYNVDNKKIPYRFWYISDKLKDIIRNWIRTNFHAEKVSSNVNNNLEELSFDFEVTDDEIEFESDFGRISVFVGVKLVNIERNGETISDKMTTELKNDLYYTSFHEEFYEDAEMWLGGLIYDKLSKTMNLEGTDGLESRYVNCYIVVSNVLGLKEFTDPGDDGPLSHNQLLKKLINQINS